MAELSCSASLPKLELSPGEVRTLIDSKVKKLWPTDLGEIPKKVTNSISKVATLVGRKTNEGNKMSDQSRSTANANFQVAGALPDQITSPQRAASKDPNYVSSLTQSYHKAQESLFNLLINNGKLNGYVLLPGGQGNLGTGDGTQLTATEMCDALDEATRQFLGEKKVENSITSARRQLADFTEMYDTCNEVVVQRLAGTGTFYDDILNHDAYEGWKKHVGIITSFAALMVALENLIT